MPQAQGDSGPEEVMKEVALATLQGHRPDDIARLTGLEVTHVIRLITSLEFTKALEHAKRELRLPAPDVMLANAAPLAVRTMIDVMTTANDPKTRLQGATKILDHGGFAPRMRADINFRGVLATTSFTEDELREMLLARFAGIRGAQQEADDGEPSGNT